MIRNTLLFTTLYALLFVLSSSCDKLEEDALPNQLLGDAPYTNTEIYTTPGSTAVINLVDWVAGSTSNSNYSSKSPSSIQITMQPQHGSLTLHPAGYLIYQPLSTVNQGVDNIGYTIMQDGKAIASSAVKIMISANKDAYPCHAGAMSDSVSVEVNNELTQLQVSENDKICTDAAVILSVALAPMYGQVTQHNNTLTYSPRTDYKGEDFLIYKLCQTQEGIGTRCTYAYVHISVEAAPCAPIAVDDSYTLDTPNFTEYVPLEVTANDTLCGADGFQLSIIQPAQQGLAYVKDSVIYYQRAKDFTGVDKLGYKICNMAGTCSESQVSITCK